MTDFDLNEWLAATPTEDPAPVEDVVDNRPVVRIFAGGNRPALRCADGFLMSVQASYRHYCMPQNNEGPYTQVEIGYPSADESLLPEIEQDGTVWRYVPVSIIEQIVEKHGGLELVPEDT